MPLKLFLCFDVHHYNKNQDIIKFINFVHKNRSTLKTKKGCKNFKKRQLYTYESCRGRSVPNSFILSFMLNLLLLSTTTRKDIEHQSLLQQIKKGEQKQKGFVACLFVSFLRRLDPFSQSDQNIVVLRMEEAFALHIPLQNEPP